MRVFILIELNRVLREQLAELQSELKTQISGVTWVNPGVFHLTLEFLGNVKPEKIDEIIQVLGKACLGVQSIRLLPTKLVLIPQTHNPRVIAVKIEGELKKYRALQRFIRKGLLRLNFQFEESRDPHITLGRIRKKTREQNLKGVIEPLAGVKFSPLDVGSIILTQSKLTAEGPIYNLLQKIPLGKPLYQDERVGKPGDFLISLLTFGLVVTKVIVISLI